MQATAYRNSDPLRSLIFGLTLLLPALANADHHEGVPSKSAMPQWDSVVGSVIEQIGEPTPHWFSGIKSDSSFLIDGDTGEVQGTLVLSMFTPAIRPHLSAGKIYAYGSYYSRTYYGERTDLIVVHDSKTLKPVSEIEIPAKSAGIGHGGMIGLIDDRFVGVWNITPAMSVSIADVQNETFVGEISTPGCAAVYPVKGGFLMPCGDGTLQFIGLGPDGKETMRKRSEAFFAVDEDPVYDYAVATDNGWLFVSFDGLVFEARWTGTEVTVSEPWSILAAEDEDTDYRIGGRQPFAYNAANNILVTLMHKGGGQETFEDAGTEIWAFNTRAKRRGYKLELGDDAKVSSLLLTKDETPLLVTSPADDEILRIYDGRTGALKREMKDMRLGRTQNL